MDRPGAIVFDTTPIPMAVRRPLPGLDPATATPRPGAGVSIWIAVPDADALHGRMVAAGIEIVVEPADSPFGRHFSFVGPEGYVLTPHDAEPARWPPHRSPSSTRYAAHGPSRPRAASQVARFLSLDVHGTSWPGIGERDPVIGEAQAAFPGLRPCVSSIPPRPWPRCARSWGSAPSRRSWW